MYLHGLLIGFMAFFMIGVFHPIVIKTEYYFGKKAWPVFLVFGIVFLIFSVLFQNVYVSSCFGITGFSCLWSIHELIEQEVRVKKGWFPSNPKKGNKS